MSEEPRRSVRSTKGFHSHKEQEIEGNLEMPKKKSSKKGGNNKKATSSKETSPTQEANEEGDIIRCICGATSQEDDDDGEQWIACELCSAWQHNVCMGVPTENVEDLPEYYCEECRPKNHKELLKAIQQGDELWITRRKAFEAKKGKKGKKPAKGKGGSAKKKSPPIKPTGQRSNGQAVESPVPSGRESSANLKKDGVAGTKRKAQEDAQVRESGKTKQRKVSDASAITATPATGAKKSSTFATPVAPRSATPTKQTSNNTTPRDLPKTIDDLKDEIRRGLAEHLQKNVDAAFKLALERGQVTDDTTDALDLTLKIEQAIHDSHHPREQYKAQSKLVAINLKRNDELFDKLLSGEVSANQLALMSEDDMKPTKQKQEEAEERARAERQSIMVKDDGPRVRRTHKGEELVEDNFGVGNEIPTREQRDPNGDMAVRSRENTPLELIQPELDVSDTIPRARQPLNINTQAGSHERKPSIQSAEFDYNKVASKLPTSIITQPTRRASGPAPPPREAVDDPEVDRMLLDDDPESPPYSPKEDSDPSIIWHGQLEMNSIGSFAATAQHVGGMDFFDQNMNYSDILGKKLMVTGRIEPEKADDYLCGLRYSPNSDVIVISLNPRGEIAAEDFGKIFTYFADRNRYGVCGSRMGLVSVRDIYLIPLEAGNGAIPLFLSNLEVNKLPETRPERTILIVIVHRAEATNPNPGGESPSLMTHAQRTTSQFQGGPAMSPLATQGAFKSPTVEQQEKHAQQLAGEAMGLEVLGPELFRAPTMAFIVPQAGVMNLKEWTVIKEILSTDERARLDLAYLGQLVADKATLQQNADNPIKNA